ncbi:ASCIZ zinc finger protein [Leptinotarsa decemlineata]|uniref:ASCIZ zinc finger protein n=1 Tax=Leptinotarsa decemlineata TaxID=7539 RepID=UPI003D309199
MDTSTAYNIPTGIKKIYPSVEECKVNNMIRCTEDGCQNVFTSESNLSLHLTKTHKKSTLINLDPCIKQYHCPELECVYNSTSCFKNIKLLRQHYRKVHAPKTFLCSTCQKSFPCENHLKLHVDYCGIDFTCCDCQSSYTSYETLKTHGRRKKHTILNKPEYKLKNLTSKSEVSLPVALSCYKAILPRTSVSVVFIPSLNKSVLSQECQTVPTTPRLKSKMTQVTRTSPYNSQQTESLGNHISVGTQTVGDFINSNQNNDLCNSLSQKNSNTQTDIKESKNFSCNTSLSTDLDFDDKIEVNNSSTQTHNHSNIFSISTMTHDSIETDTSDLMVNTLEADIDSFEFDNCHMETQTDFMFEDEMFSCDYMSNMYTQTCDDILNDFGFIDTQTQTVFDDMLRSVESQTTMSHGKKNHANLKDMMHMETQTDTEFRQLLEVINS